MRKRIVGRVDRESPLRLKWLDLEEIATVEVTSEAPGSPVESVFVPSQNSAWRAAVAGEQTVRVIFDEPTPLRMIELHFIEQEIERTQEFSLCWSAAQGGPLHQIVRQQWSFNPRGSTEEVEHYDVELDGVSTIELSINPDISGLNAKATLLKWRMG